MVDDSFMAKRKRSNGDLILFLTPCFFFINNFFLDIARHPIYILVVAVRNPYGIWLRQPIAGPERGLTYFRL